MKITGHIRDASASIVFDQQAIQLANGSYSFAVKGLPSTWSLDHANRLIRAWARKHGLNACSLAMTSSTFSKWNARVTFWLRAKTRTYEAFACPTCGASSNASCTGKLAGVVCQSRLERAKSLNGR